LTFCCRGFDGSADDAIERLAIRRRDSGGFLLSDELRQAIFGESLSQS
jgi:hypothetical protein